MDNTKSNENNKLNHPQVVDLNAFADTEKFTVEIKSKEKEDPEDAKLRRFKTKWLFIAALIAMALLFCICIGVLIFKKDSLYTGIALNSVIALTTGLAGYYVRGK